MSLTITFGWWLLPLAVTVAAFVTAAVMCKDDGSHGDYASIGNAFVALVIFGLATVVSLIAWLIWALAA